MKIVECSPRKGFRLFLRYEDGTSGEVDLSSFVGRGVFASWIDPEVFDRVRLSDAGVPEWPGEVDLCPDALYLRLTDRTPDEIFPLLRSISAHA